MEIPHTFRRLRRLIHLNLKNNKLIHFPCEIFLLERLRFCFLNSNRLPYIAEIHLNATRHIKVLDINDNPFDDSQILGCLTGYSHITYGRQISRDSRAQNDGDDDEANSDDDYDVDTDWENSDATDELNLSDFSDQGGIDEQVCVDNFY